MSAIQFSYEPSSLPTNFSAEARWGDLLSPLEDQAGHSVTIVSDYADSVTTYDTVSPLSRTKLTPLPCRTQCPNCLGLLYADTVTT